MFFFKQKTAYEMRISDWSSDVCSSDLRLAAVAVQRLDDQRAVAPVEILHRVEIAGDHRRRHIFGEIEHEHFLGRVADRDRDVAHQPLARQAFEQPGAGPNAEADGRVLTHTPAVAVRAPTPRHRLPVAITPARTPPDPPTPPC